MLLRVCPSRLTGNTLLACGLVSLAPQSVILKSNKPRCIDLRRVQGCVALYIVSGHVALYIVKGGVLHTSVGYILQSALVYAVLWWLSAAVCAL